MDVLCKKFAKYYDLIYHFKKYDEETKFVLSLIKKFNIKGKEILEMGCGTGSHTLLLTKEGFNVLGVDLSSYMLKLAKQKVRGTKFMIGDMRTFRSKKKFDISLCLFSTMHYNKNYNDLKKTIENFYAQLKSGGLLIFDMGFNKERFDEGHFTSQVSEKGNVSLARIGKTFRSGSKARLIFNYVLFEGKKMSLMKEEHSLGIFDTLKVKKIMEKIGFKTYIYNSYTSKAWTPKSKDYVVFTGIKK